MQNEEEIEDLSELEEEPIEERCPLCDEIIPSPFPARMQARLAKLFKNKTPYQTVAEMLNDSKHVIDQIEFCRVHYAETYTIPDGLKKEYPMTIDFDCIHERVQEFIPQLTSLINGETNSRYRDNVLKVYKKVGKATARKPTTLMGRFQEFLVNIIFLVNIYLYLYLIIFLSYFHILAWILWIEGCIQNHRFTRLYIHETRNSY